MSQVSTLQPRILGLGLLACIGLGFVSVSYAAGAALLAGVLVFLGLHGVRRPVVVIAVGLLAVVVWVLFQPVPRSQTPPGPGSGGSQFIPTVHRYLVTDYVARIRPTASGDDGFNVEEHLTLKPASSADGPRPIEINLPPRVVRSESIGLVERRLKLASDKIVDPDLLIPAVREDLADPAADVRLSFPYNSPLTYEVFGLPNGAFRQPLMSTAAPTQTSSQVAWSSDVHNVDNGFEYFTGPGILYPVLAAFHNLGSLSQGILLLATNIVLYLWIKVAEPILTEIAKAALKKRLPVANAAAAH
jgi:hypothetical protein